jgi:uncharacterized protein (DUF2336 family)
MVTQSLNMFSHPIRQAWPGTRTIAAEGVAALTIASQAERLMRLAQARSPADRERLLLAIADLCESADDVGALDTGTVQTLLNDIFMLLVVEAEREIRQRLAEKLACAHWAPKSLVNVLALDEIEIARPIIATSPVLDDKDLIRLLVEATIEHQIEVARRPRIGPGVVDAILEQEEPAVLTALACNDTAEVSADAMGRLVAASKRIPALRPPLVRHPALTTDLAEQLYAWVGQALRSVIVSRFEVDAEALDRTLAEAVRDAHAGASSEDPPDHQGELMIEREEMERRLIAKLHDAGQLRPGYLLRALREGKLSLFEGALAKLGGFTTEQVRQATGAVRPDLLALACVAVDLDRSVFPTVLHLVRALNGGKPGGSNEAAFTAQPGPAAAAAFRDALAAV